MSIPPEIIGLIAEEAFHGGVQPQNLLGISTSFSRPARKRLYRSISLNLNEVPWRDRRPKKLIEILTDDPTVLQYIRSITILSDSDKLMYDKSQEHSRSQVGPPIQTGVSVDGQSLFPLLNALSEAPIVEFIVDSIPRSLLPLPALVHLRSGPTLRRFVFIGRGPLPTGLAIGNAGSDPVTDVTLIIHHEILYAHDSDSDAGDNTHNSSPSNSHRPGAEVVQDLERPPSASPLPFVHVQKMELGHSSDLFNAVGPACYRARDCKERTVGASTPKCFPSPPELTFDLIALKSLTISSWMKYSTSGCGFLAIREILHHTPALEQLEIKSDFDYSLGRDFALLPPQQSPYRAIATLPLLRTLSFISLDNSRPMGALTGISEGLQEITPPNLEEMSVCIHWWATAMVRIAEMLEAVPEQWRSQVRNSLQRCDHLKKLAFSIKLVKPDNMQTGYLEQGRGEEVLKEAMEKYRDTLSCQGRIEIEYKILK